MNANRTNFDGRFFWHLGSVCTLCAALAMPALGQSAADDAGVQVTDYGTVTLQVNDTDLSQVLEMLAIQSKKNIITSKSVSATISANLFDVTFYEALDSILKVNGYHWVEEGNFIYIYTQSEWDELQAAQRTTESRVYHLDFLAASDANELITPLLSEMGQASFRGDVAGGIQPEISDVGADSWAFSAKLVVNDYPEVLDKISQFLGEMDSPPQQVLVEATVVQTALNEDNAFGIDFSVIGSVDFTDFTSPLQGVNNLLAGDDSDSGFQPEDNKAQVANSTVGGTTGPAGLKVGIMADDIAVFLRVLDEVTDTTVIARPKVMCLNRQRAEILVGARVGYLSTTATETTTTQTVEYLDTGIHLMFRPFINKDGMIRLELSPSVSEAVLRTVADANGIVVTIPDELTRELTTNVRVRDGETLVLGGLFRERNQSTRRQVPFLGDIPILGAAFRGQDDSVERDEIIFLITPNIIEDEKLWELGNESLEIAEHVLVGGRAGLLPFSNSKLTMNYNQDAVDSYNAGDIEKALYFLNNSLRLNAQQPEARQFRDQVTGAMEHAYERSMMERVLRKQLGALFLQEVPDFEQREYSMPNELGIDPHNGDWNREQRAFYSDIMYEFFDNIGMPELSPDFRTLADKGDGVLLEHERPVVTELVDVIEEPQPME